MNNSEDCPLKSNNLVTLADEALADELLKDLDLDVDEGVLVAGLVATSPAMRAVLKKQEERERERNRKPTSNSAKWSAKTERKRYAELKGSAPNAYQRNEIAPQQPHESPSDYKRRYNREYARLKRGVTAADIEANQTIRELTTPEEKKRKKADGEKRRRAGIPVKQQSADRAGRREREKEAAELEAFTDKEARKFF